MSFLRPDADSTTGNWTNELGSTPLYTSVDESVVDDGDYIKSGNLETSSPDICKLRFSDSATATLPCTVRYRYYKQVTGSQRVDLLVRLKQGASTVTSWTHSDIGTSGVTAANAVAAGITDFSDLFLEFEASMVSGLTGSPIGLLLTLTQA